MIELEAITHRFPGIDWELRIPELTLMEGEVLGIIGPNGSGKTTLLHIAAGLLIPLGGRVQLEGRDLKGVDRRTAAREMGFLPQELSSEYDLVVDELVGMGRYPHVKGWGRLSGEDRAAIETSLELTGMISLRRRRLSQLSGGEKKRAFLASVLAQQPRFLLLDEPTAALDLPHQVRFFRLLHELARDGMGIAVVTHDVNLASLYADRLLMLSAGRILSLGPPPQVLTEKRVAEVYGADVLMGRHPDTERPLVIARAVREEGE
jgi:iron complex transport system ATP-binding protein